MRRNVLIVILVAVAAAALLVGIMAARAQGSSTLPSVTPTQLLQAMASKAPQTKSISGDFAWSDDLMGTSALPISGLGGQGNPASLTSLLTGGSGRLWLQGGKARLEAQGSSGDMVVVAGPPTIWTYSSTTNTATEYTLPSGAGTTTSPEPSSTASPSPTVNPADEIAAMVEKLAPTAKLEVTGQETVAGQDAYILTLTPTSTTTSVGSVQVAVDGHTFVPLRVQVFAKGDAKAQLSAGFSSVSYSTIADGMFTFTPPAGAKVEHKALSLPSGIPGLPGAVSGSGAGGPLPLMSSGSGSGVMAPQGLQALPGLKGATAAKQTKSLTMRRAKAKAGRLGMTLMTASRHAVAGLPFAGAQVMRGHDGAGPTAVLHYGRGFGSVVLVETTMKPADLAKLQKQLADRGGNLGSKASPLRASTVNGAPSYELATSLFSVIGWQRGKVTLVSAGMVPRTELAAFAGSVH